MNEPADKLRPDFTVGPLLKKFITEAGHEIAGYAEIIGMEPAHLTRILEGGDPRWSELNRIIKPLGYHLVFQKRHQWKIRKPRIMIRRVKFKGVPLGTDPKD